MKNIQMTTVINTLHQICDLKGFFRFDDLRATGLKRVEVMQAIELMQAEGYAIGEYTFGYGLGLGGNFKEWVWVDYQKAYECALYDMSEVLELRAQQEAAVAEVERMFA